MIPIPGSRKPERLAQNLHAAGVRLSASEVTRINSVLDNSDLLVFGGHAVKE